MSNEEILNRLDAVESMLKTLDERSILSSAAIDSNLQKLDKIIEQQFNANNVAHVNNKFLLERLIIEKIDAAKKEIIEVIKARKN